MWSDRYNYYNIQSDKQFSEKAESDIVVDMILKTKFFVQKDHQSFANSETFPWVNMIITQTTNGNFASTDKPLSHVNLIVIVCSKGITIDQTIYKQAFLAIAEKLNWKLYLEANDDRNENVEISLAV